MTESLFPGHSVLFFYFQAFADKIPAFLSDMGVKINIFSHDIVNQLKLILRRPRSRAMNKLVVN